MYVTIFKECSILKLIPSKTGYLKIKLSKGQPEKNSSTSDETHY